MFLTTVCLMVYHLVVWLPRLVFSPVLRSAFQEVLTLEASPVLLFLDAAPESEPADTFTPTKLKREM